MMKTVVAICFLLLFAVACSKASGPQPEILGVRLGMSRDEAHARLQKLGRLEKEERRQQEVWRLEADPSYSHLMVAYDREGALVRYVTAVANEQGRRVAYAEVVNVGGARLDSAQASRTYTQELPEHFGRPGFVAKAIGTDPTYLKYYSVERAASGEEGEEDEDD